MTREGKTCASPPAAKRGALGRADAREDQAVTDARSESSLVALALRIETATELLSQAELGYLSARKNRRRTPALILFAVAAASLRAGEM